MYERSHEQGLKPLIKRQWRAMSLAFVLVLGAGSAYLALAPKQYEVRAKLLVMKMDQRLGGVKAVNDALPELTHTSHPLYTQIELLRTEPLLREVITQLNLRDRQGRWLRPEMLSEKIEITSIKNTDVIEVIYRSDDPTRAKQVVAALCSAYLRRLEKLRRDGVREGLRYLDEQTAASQRHVMAAEQKLLAFQRASGAIALTEEIPARVRELSDLDREVRARNVELRHSQARVNNLRAQLGMTAQQGLAMAAVSQDSRIRSLQDQLVAAESSPILAQGLAPEHPEIIALNKRIAMLRRALETDIRSRLGKYQPADTLDEVRRVLLAQLSSAEADVVAITASLQAATNNRDVLRANMSRFPGLEIELGRLQREVTIARQVYEELLKKREEARAALSIAPTDAQIIQPARLPEHPDAPLKGQTGPLVFLTALAAAFGTGILKDLLKNRIQPQDLITCLPEARILSRVPALSWQERHRGELVVRRQTSQHYVEALRSLCVALEDHLLGSGGRVVAITSALAGEGKSVTISNLALCLAEAGYRVLLVDADCHRPRLHRLFEQNTPGQGLAEILLDRLSPRDAIWSAGEIDLVKAGTMAVPARLAKLKRRLGSVLETWRSEYDFVLLDLPPLAMFSEVVHISRQVDGILLLSNLQRITPEILTSAVQQLQAVRLPLLGMVAISQLASLAEARYSLIAAEGIRS
ncbi:MAG: polysaccharide biosynthesis tyrosine autokinase [Cyanobacteria bacterium NC_groundwater_1444_Ag_S-0.65um_54_12]|nr:polysaccharide biosynthesis tyrosine autokinase [Cyanobacteria bacterium NC_groundwater_1444_Ag_S-0.65um_54_12]